MGPRSTSPPMQSQAPLKPPVVSAHLTSLPNPGAYARSWKALSALPANALVRSPGWAGSLVPAGQMRAEMRGALDRRINTRCGNERANLEVPIGLVRDARRLDDIKQRGIRVYQFETDLCRQRFSHLLARHDD